MPNAKNRKLCWNCDGSVHIHATKCPFCGTDLVAEEAPAQQTTYQAPPPPPLEAPPPPYVQRVQPQPDLYQSAPPWQVPGQVEEQPQQEMVAQVPVIEELVDETPARSHEVMPMLLLLPGAFFLLFALVLLLFSQDGALTLSWKASHWMAYLCVGLPMLFMGYRSLNRVPA